MSDSIVTDKKKLMKAPSMKLWKRLVSTFKSKLNCLRKSQLRKSSHRPIFNKISSPQQHHHHHYQTINNHHHHHYYYDPQHSDHNQQQMVAEKGLLADDKAHGKPSSEAANDIGMEIEVFDDCDSDGVENEMESGGNGVIIDAGREGSDCITLSRLQSLEVDARAEEFINQCKEVWRLEKQKSEEEYWAMLARGA